MSATTITTAPFSIITSGDNYIVVELDDSGDIYNSLYVSTSYDKCLTFSEGYVAGWYSTMR